ncbi:MAG TPA: retropepsin-like aspartic protease [Flavobacteriales bacterium]|nr:retropepsin-like aspartic protease [Flavobacteriales bacterium]
MEKQTAKLVILFPKTAIVNAHSCFCTFAFRMIKMQGFFRLTILGLLVIFSGSLVAGFDLNSPLVKRKKGRGSDFPDPIPQGESAKISIPIKRAGNLILMEVQIDSIVGNLILDTGAPHLVLNKTYFRNYPLYGNVMASGITGGGGAGNQTRVSRLVVAPGLYYSDVDADIVPLGHLESRKGVKIIGLFGLNLLKRLEIEFHLDEGELIIYRLSRSGARTQVETAEEKLGKAKTIRIFLENGLLLVPVTINEKRLRFYIDTGAETNILHSGSSKKVFEKVQLSRRTMLSGTGKEQAEVLSGELSEMFVDGHSYINMDVTIANLNSLRSVYDSSIDGMLGYSFLSRRKLAINFMKGELYLWD